MIKVYAGIGSRRTPKNIMIDMTKLAADLENRDWFLRSGGAEGADWAFEKGVEHDDNMDIIKASHCTKAAMEIASKFHPAWDKCSDYAKRLLGRNVMIILGRDLQSPVKFVAYWTDQTARGGTVHALKVAEHFKILTKKVE